MRLVLTEHNKHTWYSKRLRYFHPYVVLIEIKVLSIQIYFDITYDFLIFLLFIFFQPLTFCNEYYRGDNGKAILKRLLTGLWCSLEQSSKCLCNVRC